MARAAALLPSRSPPTPLLWPLLLLLLPLLRETGAQDVRVQVLPEVRGQLGGTVELPCHLLSPLPGLFVSLVTWERSDVPVKQQNVAAFHPKLGASFPSPEPGSERLSFVSAKQSTGQDTEAELQDATLALQGLTVEDEGNYTCEFATFPKGPVRGLTSLRVIATPQNHAEAQEVTLSPDPAPVARCISKEGRPPAQISWLSSLDGEAKETQVPGTLAGTVTITSRFILVPLGRADGVTVTCKVEHESLEEPALLPVTLSVRYPPEVSISGYDDNWYLGRTDATLSCDVRSNPEPTGYDWSTTSGTFPTSAVAQGSQLVIHAVDSLFNTTFICTVTNAVGTGRAEQVIFVRETPRASPRDMGQLVWGAVGGTLLVLLLLAGGSLAFILLRGRRKRKSPEGGGGGGGGGSGDGGFFDAKTQVLGNGDPVFWTPVVPGPTEPDGKEEEEEEEEEKAEKGLMLPPPPALEDDMESQLDGSLISRRAVYV
ncbi:nectin-2 isoform X3 [Cebus imitator]|uniref:Nectin cell adhesion molecule 2 n=1 Tax=Cebus imitator TaxID=2715852 RepID=A0A2K5QKF6_CEBIM|nr:nectin-2 isoform X2 [Cebus imitator]XP_017357914.1 nectin-2 isoform X3 [Cebus imitator]